MNTTPLDVGQSTRGYFLRPSVRVDIFKTNASICNKYIVLIDSDYIVIFVHVISAYVVIYV